MWTLLLLSLSSSCDAGEHLFNIDSGRYVDYQAPPNQHFTAIFNTFVMMTFFNEIGSRKIHGEHNVFSGMHRNPLFIGILAVTFIAQVRFRFTRVINNDAQGATRRQ